MTWVQKELKKKSAAQARNTAPGDGLDQAAQARDAAAKIAALWRQVEDANNALPGPLRLQREVGARESFAVDAPNFPVMLLAQNGACLGFAEDGIRYVWPVRNRGKSNNFWIRWNTGSGYFVNHRVGSSLSGPIMRDRKFKASSVDLMLKCLVRGVRIKPGSVSAKRFWLF